MMPLTSRLLLMGSLQAQALWRHGMLQSCGPGGGPCAGGPAPQPSPIEPGEGEEEVPFVPLLLLAIFLVSMAGLMSGLTLGLMSLDQVDLEILRRSGTEKQKRLAQDIQPVLRRPHVLLVTLLVCNAVAAEALPLVLDRMADPITAVLVSVTVVLFFGEIIPQAACSRYGLQIGAYSAPFVRLLMFVTAPISLPIGWVLDRVLGDRHTALFRRAELKALMDIHGEAKEGGGHLSADEVCIIKGALDMTHKTARDAMTPIDMVFMLPADARLDEHTLTAIMASGHSRIPVCRPGDRGSILGIMLVKELLLVDASQGKMVGRQKVRSIPFVRADTPLYDMLKLFEIGRSHMAVLMQLRKEAAARRRKEREASLMIDIDSLSDDPSEKSQGDNGGLGGVNGGGEEEEEEEEGCLSPRRTATREDFIFDPTDYEPVGIITIEDVLEELLQAEILDETDQFVDNLQRTPINTALLMGSLPPHLRGVLSDRAHLPRIGGAAFMHDARTGGGSLAAAAAAASHGGDLGLGLALGLGLGRQQGAQVAAAVAAADAEAGSGAASPHPKPGAPSLSPRSPRSGAVSPVPGGGGGGGGAGGLRPPRPPPSARGGGGGTAAQPGATAGGSMHGGLLYKQGAVGAALVAEALRHEVALQMATAAAASRDAGAAGSGQPPTGRHFRSRSRSRSPLPRHPSADEALLGHPLQQPGAAAATAAAAAAAGQQQWQQQSEPVPMLFPGLPRSRSDAAANSSGASTPRMVNRSIVPLAQPPARRSTNVTTRVQEQMDLLQPLLISSRRNSNKSQESELSGPS